MKKFALPVILVEEKNFTMSFTIVNPQNYVYATTLYYFQFGLYGKVAVLVWGRYLGFEDALNEAVEWLSEYKPKLIHTRFGSVFAQEWRGEEAPKKLYSIARKASKDWAG